MTAHDESIPPRPSKKPRKKKDEAARIANQLELRKALQELGIAVSYDEFKLTITLEEPLQRPGIGPPQDFVPRTWCDTDDTALAEILNHLGFRRAISNTLIRDVVHLHAVTTRSFHPVREYLDGLRWDGVPRIADFFATHCGALDDLNNDPDSKALDPELREQANDRLHKRIAYLRVVGQIFFVSAVARIFEPGCKNDCMLILEGPQSALKSTLLRVLARRDEWFAENPPDRFDKDAMLWLLGFWFAEYAEVDYHLKRGSKFKAWVSTSTDRYRPPYARSPVYVGRQCVFVGTTNRIDYLHDRTGNRRFLPVAVRNIDLDAVRPIVDALWAEAVALYRAGAKALGFTERKRESRKGSRQYVFRKPARDGREAENVTEFPERAAGPPR